MTIFARSLARLAGPAPRNFTRTRLALTLAITLALMAAIAAPVGAQVTSIGPVQVGLQPRVGATVEPEPKTYSNPEGHPVVHGAGTYAIYWDPTDHYHGDWQELINTYLQNVGAMSGSLSNVFAVDTQYTDKSNLPARFRNVFHGAYTDTSPYPASGCTDPAPFEGEDLIGAGETPVCLTSSQVATQVEAFVAAHALPKGMGSIYYLLTPPGVSVCLDAGGAAGHCSDYEATVPNYQHSFCSYHAAINPGGLPTGDGNTILYGVIPWSAGGFGDGHLRPADQLPGSECQDGGFDPSSKPPGKLEKAHEKNKKEKEAFNEMDAEEKAKAEEAELLEGPHQQEPNQTPCPSTDGTCDYGLGDLITNQLALEQQNIVTNPLLNAWQDAAKAENTDQCRFDFAPINGGAVTANPETKAGTLSNQELGGRNYYLNDAFNLAALRLPYPGVGCLVGVTLDPKFTAPNPVNASETVGFDGMESAISLNAGINFPGAGAPAATYATYSWNFGDGATAKGYAPGAPVCEAPWLSPCAASAFHSYTYGGSYNVTLTVTDVGGNVANVSHEVVVDGPPPPSTSGSGAVPGAGAGAGAGAGSGSTPGAGGGKVPVIVNPVAAATVVSHSLRGALKKGLVVRYSVNEQVAGRFEVMISSALARRLKLGGPPATGLPAGTPPQVVIAKAILVTTKGGRSTIDIKFSKHVAERLKHAHTVPLMLRLVVRNAAAKSPVSTTVLSTVTLSG